MKPIKYIWACIGLGMTLLASEPARADASAMLSQCEVMLRDMRQDGERVRVPTGGLPCWYFMSAVQELITVSPDASGPPYLRVCAPANSTLIQLIRIFVRYAQQNPKELNQRAGDVVLRALLEAYPCR